MGGRVVLCSGVGFSGGLHWGTREEEGEGASESERQRGSGAVLRRGIVLGFAS